MRFYSKFEGAMLVKNQVTTAESKTMTYLQSTKTTLMNNMSKTINEPNSCSILIYSYLHLGIDVPHLPKIAVC